MIIGIAKTETKQSKGGAFLRSVFFPTLPTATEASKQNRIANSVALKAVVDVRCRALEIAGGLAAAHIAQGKKFGSTEVCAVADELVAWVLGGVEGSTEMLANLIQAIDNGKETL